MKLSISNIAWRPEDDQGVYALLRELGIDTIEAAPTRIVPNWEAATTEAARLFAAQIQDEGLRCSSLQSLLYGLPALSLFGTDETRRDLARQLDRVANFGDAMGARAFVFGSPKNRDRGSLTDSEAFAIAAKFFSGVSESFSRRGVCLCLEPNPTQYDCNFVTDSAAGAALVRAVGSPGFRLHLDAACMHLAEEDGARAIESCADVLAHFHISEPFLRDFANPEVDHRSLASALRGIGWSKPVVVEMRATDTPLKTVRETLHRVSELYG